METQNNNITEEVKVEKKGVSVTLIVLVIGIIGAFAFSWVFGMKQYETQKELDKIKDEVNKGVVQDSDTTKNNGEVAVNEKKFNNFLANFEYVLVNVFDGCDNCLIPVEKRNSSNLFDDDELRFMFTYYFLERYGLDENKIYNVDANGEEVTGLYAVKYDYFKQYYKELTGLEFNEEILNSDSSIYSVNGDYLYGKTITGYSSHYNFTKESFIKNEDKYYLTVLIEELDEADNVSVSYRCKFELSKNNEKYMINSMITY